MKIIHTLFFTFLFLILSVNLFPQIIYPGKLPGKAVALHSGNNLSIENAVVKIIFQVNKNQIHPEKFIDKVNEKEINLLPFDWFFITLKKVIIKKGS